MDPNTIMPSPPSSRPTSIYASPSNESLRSAPSSPSKTIPPTSASVPQLPYIPQFNIMKYVAEELEAISFDILQQFAPALLEEQGFECEEQIELNWACRQFAYHCTGIEIDLQSLTDWIPDIRHAAVHRHQMTALAACKTIHEAANLAFSLGSEEVGDKLRMIALEMDWARCEMIKHGALNDKMLPADIKQAVVDRLRGAISAAKDNVGRDQTNEWKLSDGVVSYTMDEKLLESPWADPKLWGQDRNRNYFGSSRSESMSPPRGRQLDNWRSRSDNASLSISPPRFSNTAPCPSISGKSQAYIPPAKRQGVWIRGTSR